MAGRGGGGGRWSRGGGPPFGGAGGVLVGGLRLLRARRRGRRRSRREGVGPPFGSRGPWAWVPPPAASLWRFRSLLVRGRLVVLVLVLARVRLPAFRGSRVSVVVVTLGCVAPARLLGDGWFLALAPFVFGRCPSCSSGLWAGAPRPRARGGGAGGRCFGRGGPCVSAGCFVCSACVGAGRCPASARVRIWSGACLGAGAALAALALVAALAWGPGALLRARRDVAGAPGGGARRSGAFCGFCLRGRRPAPSLGFGCFECAPGGGCFTPALCASSTLCKTKKAHAHSSNTCWGFSSAPPGGGVLCAPLPHRLRVLLLQNECEC